MSSLSDQIDRLSRNTRVIKVTAANIAIAHNHQLSSVSLAGPFARAVLSTPLGDLIRDIDTSELGLFNLTTSRDQHARGLPAAEITRKEFSAPTPLRKAFPRPDMPKPKDIDPETYAEAALKYIGR